MRWMRSGGDAGGKTPAESAPPPDRLQVVQAAAPLFRARGFHGVAISDVAQAMAVADDAIRASFSSKATLFEAVYVQELHLLAEDLQEEFSCPDPGELMFQVLDGWLDALKDEGRRQIVVLDAPDALGWDSWRRSGDRYDRILMETTLSDAMDKGVVPEQPVRPLGHVLSGAMEAGIYYAAQQSDPETALEEVRASLHVLLGGIIGQGVGSR